MLCKDTYCEYFDEDGGECMHDYCVRDRKREIQDEMADRLYDEWKDKQFEESFRKV